jgi:hypothetical protein
MTNSSAPRGWKLLLAAGAVLMFVAGLLVVTSRNILNSTRFGANIAASLADDRVASYVAGHLTDVIIAQKPDLVTVRPILLSSVRSIVGSEPFRAVVRTSARSAHKFFFEQAGQRLVLSLPDLGTVVRSALEQASPAMAAKIPPGIEARLASQPAEQGIATFLRLWKLGGKLLTAAWIAWYAGILLIVLGIAVAPDRRRGLAESGVALITVALVFLAIVPALRLVISAAFPDQALAGFVHGVITAFLGRLRIAALLVGIPGLLLLTAGTAALDRDLEELAHRLARLVTSPPAAPAARLGWALGFLAVGAALLIWPMQLLSGLAFLLGVGVMLFALREVFRLVIGYRAGQVASGRAIEGRRWPIAAGAVVVVLGLGGAGSWLLRSERGEPAIATTALCNGSAVLCSRTVDQVVFPTAHNAFSNTSISDWMFPHHLRSMPQMLQDGVRGLLIDIHYGIPTGGAVKTDMDAELTSEFGFSSRAKIEGALGPEGMAVAMRIRDRLVAGKDAAHGLYFCHGFCEIGAYPVAPVLTEIHDWLVANPGEVIVMSIEDYVLPTEIDSVFRASGLVDFVYTGSTTTWPTLRELIDSNRRLIVLLESGHTGVPYLLPGFQQIMVETKYSFRTPADFNCQPNRGTTGSLFMMNHWIETTPTPKPSNAAIVNAYDVLLARARKCQRERHHLPNLIAVDFAGVGDLLRVANTLNGIPEVAPDPR